MSGIRVEGATSTNLVEVTANGELYTRPTLTPANAGYVKLADRYGQGLSCLSGRPVFGQENLLHSDPVSGAILDSRIWRQSATTAAIATSLGYISLNSAQASSGSAIINTWNRFRFEPQSYINFTATAVTVDAALGGCQALLGFGNSILAFTATASFVGFMWNVNGSFVASAGGRASAANANAALENKTVELTRPSDGVVHDYEVRLCTDTALYYIDNVLVATINLVTTPQSLRSFITTSAPTFGAAIINLITGGKMMLKIGPTSVTSKNLSYIRSNNIQQSNMNRSMVWGPLTTFAQTTNHTNSTSPTSATLANTTTQYATLGGRYQWAAITSNVVATDYALFAYQVPAGWRLFVDGVRISCANTGATVATRATIIDYSLGVNGTALDLSTADTLASGTFATRRIPLGMHGFPVGILAGVTMPPVIGDFKSAPICIESGRYIHVIMEVPLCANTGSEIFRGDVLITGWWE
jgi:hypothetical protein